MRRMLALVVSDDDFDGDDHDQNDEMMATKSTYDNSEDDYRTGPAGTFLH